MSDNYPKRILPKPPLKSLFPAKAAVSAAPAERKPRMRIALPQKSSTFPPKPSGPSQVV